MIDFSPQHSDFYSNILSLLLAVIFIVLAAVVLILWDLIGLLFTPIVEVLKIAKEVKKVADQEHIPERISASKQMLDLAEELVIAKDKGFLKNYSDGDPVQSLQLQNLCSRLAQAEANLKKIDQLDESTKCHKVLKLFVSEMDRMDADGDGQITRAEFVAAGGSKKDFDSVDLDGSGTVDEAELDAMIAAKSAKATSKKTKAASKKTKGGNKKGAKPTKEERGVQLSLSKSDSGSGSSSGSGASSGVISSSAWQFQPNKKKVGKLNDASKELLEAAKDFTKEAKSQLEDKNKAEEEWKKGKKNKLKSGAGWALKAVQTAKYAYDQKLGNHTAQRQFAHFTSFQEFLLEW